MHAGTARLTSTSGSRMRHGTIMTPPTPMHPISIPATKPTSAATTRLLAEMSNMTHTGPKRANPGNDAIFFFVATTRSFEKTNTEVRRSRIEHGHASVVSESTCTGGPLTSLSNENLRTTALGVSEHEIVASADRIVHPIGCALRLDRVLGDESFGAPISVDNRLDAIPVVVAIRIRDGEIAASAYRKRTPSRSTIRHYSLIRNELVAVVFINHRNDGVPVVARRRRRRRRRAMIERVGDGEIVVVVDAKVRPSRRADRRYRLSILESARRRIVLVDDRVDVRRATVERVRDDEIVTSVDDEVFPIVRA